MGFLGFMVYLAIVVAAVVAAVMATKMVYEKVTGDEIDLDFFFPDFFIVFIVAVLAAAVAIWLNCQIGQFVAKISDFEKNVVVYEVKGIELMNQQTSKSSSAAYYVWTDQDGALHEDRASNIKVVDSDAWRYEIVEYKTVGWLKNQFYRKGDEETMYIPLEQLFNTDK